MASKLSFSQKVKQAADDMERLAKANAAVGLGPGGGGGGTINYYIGANDPLQGGGRAAPVLFTSGGSGGGGGGGRAGLDELTRALNFFGISGSRASGIRSSDGLISQLIAEFRREMEFLMARHGTGIDIRKAGMS